jgi:hypothetical protein
MRLIVLLSSVLLLVFVTACGSEDPEPADPADAVPTQEGEAPEMLKFQSGVFANEYLRDAAASDARFNGKMVELTGVITTFGTNKDDVAYVNMQGIGGGDSGGAPIQCVFTEPGAKEVFSGLSPGLPATIRGIAQGHQDTVKDQEGQVALFSALGEIITLGDCLVVE